MKNEFAKLFNVLDHQVLITKNHIQEDDKYLFKIKTNIDSKEFKLTFGCNTKEEINKEFFQFDNNKAALFVELFKEHPDLKQPRS